MVTALDAPVPVGFGPCPCGQRGVDPAPAWVGPLAECLAWRPFSPQPGDAATVLAGLAAQGLCGYALTGAPCGCDLAAALRAGSLPVEPAAGLAEAALLESFAARAAVYRRWRQLLEAGLNLRALQAFHARHKYLVMSRHVPTYRQLGRLLAAPESELQQQAERVLGLIMAAQRRPATRAGLANALAHIQGYLKRQLDPAQRAELSAAIEAYRLGRAPLLAPLALLQHHFRRHPDPYIEEQVLLRLHPAALALLDQATHPGATGP